jgi:hypothetical protein
MAEFGFKPGSAFLFGDIGFARRPEIAIDPRPILLTSP